MYLTLAVSAATREACAALVEAAERTDPRPAGGLGAGHPDRAAVW
jgi:hypothetical protein